MDLLDLLGEFLEVAIPGSILLAILYGIFILGRRGYRQIVAELSEDSEETNDGERKKLTYEQKKKGGVCNENDLFT